MDHKLQSGEIMNRSKRKRLICIIVAAILACGGLIYLLWAGGVFLPGWAEFTDREFEACEMKITLKGRSVQVTADEAVVWESAREIKVQDCFTADVDRDGREELIILCWKRGRYGRSKPFFVEKDPKVWSQHVYIYTLDKGSVKPMWMASDTGVDISRMEADEKGRITVYEPSGETSVWQWISWGLVKVK